MEVSRNKFLDFYECIKSVLNDVEQPFGAELFDKEDMPYAIMLIKALTDENTALENNVHKLCDEIYNLRETVDAQNEIIDYYKNAVK